MIKLNKIQQEQEQVEVFDLNGNSLGFASEFDLLDFRCQIAESYNPSNYKEAKEPSGYFVKYNNEIIHIKKDGSYNCPPELWNGGISLLTKIFKK